jgi:hypothetical protein
VRRSLRGFGELQHALGLEPVDPFRDPAHACDGVANYRLESARETPRRVERSSGRGSVDLSPVLGTTALGESPRGNGLVVGGLRLGYGAG